MEEKKVRQLCIDALPLFCNSLSRLVYREGVNGFEFITLKKDSFYYASQTQNQ